MPTERLVLIGGGGHAKVVLDAYRLGHLDVHIEVHDDDPAKHGEACLGIPIGTPIGPLDAYRCACHVAIGHNETRRRIGVALAGAGSTLVSVVHPRAIVSADSEVGAGAFVAAGAVIAPASRLGVGAIVNHLAIVDHDCVVGDWCHIAPGAVLGGGVTVGSDCLLGSGAVVLPGVTIGDRAVIGAGAVVTRDVAPGATVAGSPAKEMNERR